MDNVPATSGMSIPNSRSGVIKTRVNKFFLTLKSLIINKKKIFILFGILILVLFGFQMFSKKGALVFSEKWDKLVLDQQYTPSYILSPSQNSKYGIVSQEIFILKTKDPQDESIIRNNLISSKPVKITKTNDTEFKIIPANSLGIDETISFSMNNDKNYSWVFQTAPKFKVLQSLPTNKAKSVPVNAGIEITFNNDNFDLKNSDVEIQPKIDFRIEKHDEKASIVPLSPLQPMTVYNVTIRKGFSLFSGNNFISEDYNFSFQTSDENANKGRISLAKDFQEIFPDEHLITKVYANNFDANETIKAEVYKFPSVDKFVSSRSTIDKMNSSWMQYYGEQNMVDSKSLTRVATADLKLQERDNLQYLELPQNLDEGTYLVQFWFDNYKKVEQLWVQSSFIAGYVSVGKLQTVVWVNSSKNEPLGSSTISVLGTGNTYSTNNEGWAAFPTPTVLFSDNLKHYLLITSLEGNNLVLPVDNLTGKAKPDDIVAEDYWSYIYHERILYKPNDTIYFWGVAKNRDTGTPPPNVDIYLGDTLSQSVVPQSDGSFIGKIQLNDAPVGYKNISSKVNGVILSQSYFQVSDYVKPELKIEIEGNKKAIYAGESVSYKARVAFFDGTPASNVNLYISTQYSCGSVDKTEATADRNGEVIFKYQSKFDTPNSYPRYEGVNVSAIKSGDAPSDGSASVYVYGSRLRIDTISSQKGNQATLEVTVNNLDLSLINDKGLSDPVSGPAGNQKVSLTTTKTWYEQKQTGTYYDFVEKVTRPSYSYTRHDNVVEQKDLYTNADGKITYNLNLELNNSYQVKLTSVDSQGNTTEDTSYFYYSDYQNNSGQSPKAYLNLDRDSNLFGLGDEVDIKLQKNGTDYQKTDSSKFLFVLANRGRQDVYVSNNPELKFNFEQKDIPEVYVGSIIFNGRYYEEVNVNCKSGWSCGGYDYYDDNYFFNPLLIQYQKDNSKLDVSITTDKTKYHPGDKASVTVKATKNGNPVSGASVQLTAVDEALAAIGGVKEPSILTSLYKQTSDLIYYNYYSHKPALPNGPQAERGGGGGGRDLFKDTAFFDTSKTDSNGTAMFTINLPDNITNWLTYAQVMTDSVDAGQAKSSIIATKDFFITSQFPNTITTKDNPLVAVSAFGNALNESSQITAEATFDKDEQEIAKNNLQVNAFKESYFEFPKLTVGKYSVTVKGDYQNYEDGITLPVSVVNSRLDFNMTANKVLQKGDVLKSFDGTNPESGKPVKLLVTDEGKGKYYYNLLSYCYQNSNRLEKRVSSIKADEIIASRFKDSVCSGYNSDLSDFQDSDGGLKQVEWGGSDLETTLWAVYVNPSPFNKEKLIGYFENYNSYSTQDKILQNWGLTILGIPKINELNQLSQLVTSYKEKILSALALYSAGNIERSKEIYMNIVSEYAYTNKPYLRIQADPTKTDYNTYALDTSYTLLLGTLNNVNDYNDGFNLYLRDYSGEVSTVVLDIANISYIDKILANLPDKDTTVSFKTSSQNLTKNITKDGSLRIDLKQSEINNFNLSVTDGKADAILSYYLTPDEYFKLQSDNRISLTKTVTKVKGDTGSAIKIGDILEVDLKYDFDSKAPLGCYTLTDEIPSGMTYLDNPDNYGLTIGQKGTLYPEKANIVKGCAGNSSWWKSYTNNTSVYFVRVTGAGKFVQESAIIQSSIDSSIFQKTSEEYVTVGE